MTPEQRIERFFEKHYPAIRTLIYIHRSLGEDTNADYFKDIAEDLHRLRHPPASEDLIEYYI